MHKINCCTAIHKTQPQNNYCEDFVYVIRVEVYLFIPFLSDIYRLFYPDGKCVSVTAEKGTN